MIAEALPTHPTPASERRATRRLSKRERDRAARDEAARRQEATDELIAPKAQRDRRLVRDGVSFRAASPLVRLYKSGERRSSDGDEPTINGDHVRCAERLHRAWSEAQTITVGVGSYGESVRGTPQSGVMAAGVMAAVNHQLAASFEVAKVRRALGPLWGIVEAVALLGMDVKTWNLARDRRMDAMAASGYLRAGLDVVVEFYRAEDAGGTKPLVRADGLTRIIKGEA